MKKINLTQGQFALVDDEDYEYLNQWKWYAALNWGTRTFYATRYSKKGEIEGPRKRIFMHRVIMKTPKGLFVDHINHDTINNCKINLRNCTTAENCRNRKINSRNTTGYKGVTKRKKSVNFDASIAVDGKTYHLGSFKTAKEAKEAYEAYCKYAEKYHGKFKNLG